MDRISLLAKIQPIRESFPNLSKGWPKSEFLEEIRDLQEDLESEDYREAAELLTEFA